MSHTTEVQTEIKDMSVLEQACAMIGASFLGHGNHTQYMSTFTGVGVMLPGWTYPIVVDMDTGRVQQDNYNGRWGDIAELNKLTQRYAAEKIKFTLKKQNKRFTETTTADGNIEITF